jgi:enhancing lycopene biosynthesis protein 2
LEAATSFGANVIEAEVHEVCIDEQHKIVTSPAFMYNGKFHEIQDGVGNMINQLMKMI